MKIHDCLQGSDEWLALRVGKVTASELDRLVDTKFEMRTGEGPKTFLYEKAAESFRGQPLPGFSSWETEEGQAMEDDARRWFAAFTTHKVRTVGFVESDDGLFGCSPDGLLDHDGGVEIKSPQVTNQIRYFLEGRVPPAYLAQIHGSIFATGRPWWAFVSYRRHYPPVVIKVKRDDAICEKIQTAVTAFHAKLTAAVERLKNA